MHDVGHGMTVDGAISARQATKAGECVVLGSDGIIPSDLLPASGKTFGASNVYRSYAVFYSAFSAAEDGAEIMLSYQDGASYATVYIGRKRGNNISGVGFRWNRSLYEIYCLTWAEVSASGIGIYGVDSSHWSYSTIDYAIVY